MGMARTTSAARRPSGLQVLRSVGLSGSTVQKPRIIHTYSPKVYKIKPEEFLDLVQKLTGRAGVVDVDTELSVAPSRYRHHVEFSTTQTSMQRDSSSVDDSHQEEDSSLAGVELALGTPVSTQLLSSLPSPRFVTLNFLPMLATTPSAFTPSRRDAGLSLRSAAY